MTKHSAMLRIKRVVVNRRWLSGNPDGLLDSKASGKWLLGFIQLSRVGP